MATTHPHVHTHVPLILSGVVVALIGEEATVKRLFREADHIRLQPENEEMEPILTTEARVLGRVVGVFRKV